MREEGRESDNIEDRRGMPVKGIAAGGGVIGIIVLLIAMFTGKDVSNLVPPGGQQQADTAPIDPRQEPLRKLVAVVLADTEDVWGDLLPKYFHKPYEQPKLVLFSQRVESACGMASSATGPFYCPGDHKVYLDLAFFDELKTRFHAPGDFACAYVVAHEVGHHVQNLLGVSADPRDNQQSVRLELQADYLAGVWAFHANKAKSILESGDVEAALNAANAIGDDTLQKQARGTVVPDSFTHGTSAQRVRWFKRGLETGDVLQMKQLFELDYNQL